MKILSEKCGMEEGEVRERYEEFLVHHPEGEISKEEYIGSMKVNYLPNDIDKVDLDLDYSLKDLIAI